MDPAVLVVDAAGNGDFVEVADAVSQAPQGALILVKSGVYLAPVQIDARSVALVADSGASVQLERQLVILNVAATSQVVVSGIALTRGFRVEACAGPVRLASCVVPPPPWRVDPPANTMYWEWSVCGFGGSAQSVSDSAAVTLVDCTLHGADGMQWGWGSDGAPADHGLLVESSTVALYDCVLRGGVGGSASSPGHYPVVSGAGGDGLRVRGAGSDVRTTGLSSIGGAGGTFQPGGNGSFGVTFGCDGQAVRSDLGSITVAAPVDDLEFSLPSVARSAQPPLYTIEAPAGALVFVMLSPAQSWRAFAPESGHLHLAAPTTIVPLGTMPSGGVLQRPLPLSSPVSPFGHRRVELQVYATIGGVDRYSEPRTIVVVDPAL